MVDATVEKENDAGFPKSYRLLSRNEFKNVFDQRTSVSDSILIVYAAKNERDHCRMGLVVSRKVGVAVVRNKWKRLIREAFRLQQGQLPSGLDLVILPRQGAAPDWDAIQRGIVQLARRVSVKVGRQQTASLRKADRS